MKSLLPTVILMAKAPAPGQVKTRLGQEIGMAEAARVYRRLVERQVSAVPLEWRLEVCFAPAEAEREMRAWLGERPVYRAQVAGTLGDRLHGAMATHFAREAGPLIFVGGDCPYLTAERLRAAAAALEEAPAALVPAEDGGYCLLALREPVPAVFMEISWSTDAVLEQTRQRLRAAGLAWRELPALEDVDEAASWERAQAQIPGLACDV